MLPLKHANPLFHKAALGLLLVAAALTMVTLPQSRLLAACSGSDGSGCSQVIGGHWSYWLAVLPVQWAGLAMYAGLTATAWRLSPSSTTKRMAIRALCGVISRCRSLVQLRPGLGAPAILPPMRHDSSLCRSGGRFPAVCDERQRLLACFRPPSGARRRARHFVPAGGRLTLGH